VTGFSSLFQILLSNIPTTTAKTSQQKNICLRNLLRTPLLANQPLKPKKNTKNKTLSPSLPVSIFDLCVVCVRASLYFLPFFCSLCVPVDLLFIFIVTSSFSHSTLHFLLVGRRFFSRSRTGPTSPSPAGFVCFLFSLFLFNFLPLVLSGRAHTCPPLYAPQRAHTHTHAHHKGVCCVVWILFGWWLLLCVCGSVRPGGGEGRFQKKSNRFPFFAWGGAGIGASLSVAPRFHMARQQMHPPYRCVFFILFHVRVSFFSSVSHALQLSSLTWGRVPCVMFLLLASRRLCCLFSLFFLLSPLFFFSSSAREEGKKAEKNSERGEEE